MRKGLIVMVALAQFLSGGAAQALGLFSRGENASYSATNLNRRAVEDVELTGSDGRSYDSALSTDPYSLKSGFTYTPFRVGVAGGGNQYMSDTGHKVPEEMFVTWRELPPAGVKPYTGQRKGPFRVKVREKIPREVLFQIRKPGVSLQMIFAFSDDGLLFDWQLIEFKSVSGSGSGIDVLRQGGDSFK